MKCIDKKRKITICITMLALLLTACSSSDKEIVTAYENENYNHYLYEEELFASQLCVSNQNIEAEGYQASSELHAGALFGVDQKQVFYSEQIHDRLYPASTTKILTFYLAIKYGNLSDVVTVSHEAASVPSDSSVAGLKEGEKLTLEDLLYGLMLPSGNDSAVAIAEHISGSSEAFVELMNQEANMLGATNSHFTNPHGYQDADHYTTAYDLYLIFQKCVQNSVFRDVISASSYTADIEEPDGTVKSVTWKQSNLFVNGQLDAPEGVTVIGGKTGTTDEAGACLILYSEDQSARPYISVVMGADTKSDLYDTMTSLLTVIPTLS